MSEPPIQFGDSVSRYRDDRICMSKFDAQTRSYVCEDFDIGAAATVRLPLELQRLVVRHHALDHVVNAVEDSCVKPHHGEMTMKCA